VSYAPPAQANDVVALESRGEALLKSGDLAGADACFARIIELEPRHLRALQFLGIAATGRRDLVSAEALFRRALEVAPDNPRVHFNLALVLQTQRQFDAALHHIEQCLAGAPRYLAGHLQRGLICESLGRKAAAVSSYLRALRLADARGPARLPGEVRRSLNHASAVVREQLADEIAAALAPLSARHGENRLRRVLDCADIFSGRRAADYAHPRWRPRFMYLPGLPVKPVWEREDLPWLAAVEARTEVVRGELEGVLGSEQGFAPYVDNPPGSRAAEEWKALNRSRDWSTFHFFRHGERIEENCRRCPETAAMLESLDQMRVPGYAPEAMFSVLKPHTRIQAHFGSVNGRLIVHLPLIVPPDCGALRVAGEERGWTEGRCLVFDDSFEHEAWNDSDQTRIVLIFDTWNPDLSHAEREAFATLMQVAKRFELSHRAAD
jgi:aspartate beta-hydroxylase